MFLPCAEVLLYEEERERYCTFMNGVPPNGVVSNFTEHSYFTDFFHTHLDVCRQNDIFDE